ncbi:MAG: transcription antitermination factor NusB [Bacteroidaceae bacterium]|nr:transcription antitermination factor NusB [Bacteroidaceae bacterium]MBR1467817.1 transcription antitermination factor NusB [Bacteroidaceae bacterium]
MINRELIRLKTIQVVYSTEINSGRRYEEVEEELVRSLGTAYDMYNTMLSLMVAISRLALRSFDAQSSRAERLGESLPNRKFVDNRFMLQLEGNRQLRENADVQRVDWSNEEEFVRTLLNQVTESDCYRDYMANPESTYQEDRDLWKQIYRTVISCNEELDNFLEDVNLYWNDDRFVIDTFVIKTINKFQEDSDDFMPLLPEFRTPEDLEFARRLVSQSVRASDYYKNLIGSHTHNWDMERIPLMDRVILQVGLAEITSFPTIPVQVSINEYVEISKYYSTPNSPRYINATLDNISKKLMADHKLIKQQPKKKQTEI